MKKDTTVYILESRQELIEKNGRMGLAEKSRWRGIVNFLVGDCLESSEIRLGSLRLSDISLTRLTIKYNECRDAPYVEFRAQIPWIDFYSGLVLGIARNELHPEDQTGANFSNYDYLAGKYTSYDPTIGLLFEILSPRISDRISFQLELHYWKSAYRSFVSLEGRPSTNNDVYINLTTLSVPFSFKYKFNRGNLSPFVQLGFNYDNHLETSGRWLSEEVRSGETNTNPEREAFLIKKNQIGYWGGAGVRKTLSKFQVGLSVRAYLLSPLDESSLLQVNANRIALNLTLLTR